MEDRIVELEIRYTHLQREVEQLNDVVFEQQKTIATLVAQVKELRSGITQLGEQQPAEKPPHY